MFALGVTDVQLTVLPEFLYKNQELWRAPLPICMPVLEETACSLCKGRLLKRWLVLTKNIISEYLFVNPKTWKPLSEGRLLHFLCISINKADPGMLPKGHDVRKVVTSLACARGLGLTELLMAVFWKSPSYYISTYLLRQVAAVNPCIALPQKEL